ncbi:MAG TPA: phage holin family protein [Candidatus Angelobacter sp.]|nr:phage holin family protein [Candidatus Angelobacter sp.]
MPNEKSIAAVLAETKDELLEFLETRIAMLRAEIQEKISTWKYAIPMLVCSLAILLAAWTTLTIALMAFIHTLFLPSAYAWSWAGLIVGVAYLAIGGGLFWFAWSELRAAGIAPVHTMEVLKEDQLWIRKEARAA